MLRKLKNNRKILLGTIVVLSVINLSCFSLSQAKYISEKEYALNYKGDFYDLNTQKFPGGITLINKAYEEITVRFSFDRNKVSRKGEVDTYTINIPDGCSIKDINEVNASVKGKINKNTITYNDIGNATVTVDVVCSVPHIMDSSEENIIIDPISITEHVGSDRESFTYINGKYSITTSEYFQDLFTPSKELKVSKTALSIYEQLKYLLEKSYFPEFVEKNQSDYIMVENAIYEYISIFKDATSSNISEKSLKGLTVDTTSDSEYYIFKIENNFNGYALTFSNTVNSALNNMYFSTDIDSVQIKTIFKEYLDYLVAKEKYNEDDLQIINEYLNNKDIESYILNDTPLINGLVRQKDGNIIIINIKGLLHVASSNSDIPIAIPAADENTMHNNFKMQLENCIKEGGDCFDKNISEKMVNKIVYNLYIYSSIIKNNQGNTNKTAFSDYFLVYLQDESGNIERVILHIFSSGELEDGIVYTNANIESIANLENITIDIIDNPDLSTTNGLSIKFTMLEDTLENRSDLVNNIRLINSYFGITLDETDDEILGKLDENLSITYDINLSVTKVS